MSALRAMPVERFGRDEALLNIDEWCLHSHAISQRNLKTVIRSVDQRKEMPNDILCARLQHQPMCGLVCNKIERKSATRLDGSSSHERCSQPRETTELSPKTSGAKGAIHKIHPIYL
jgi:hypothetical protein